MFVIYSNMETNNENTMSEGMYLDAMNQLKELNEKREEENRKNKEELIQLKKELITCYGIVRLLDNLKENHPLDEPAVEVKICIETLRDYLSQFVEENILGVVE